jgi:hypothetical protein
MGKNSSSAGTGGKGTKNSSSSGTGSSSSGGDGIAVPTTEGGIIGLYNDAVAKNASLSGVEFKFVNTITENGKLTAYNADVKYNNNSQSPVFDIANDLEEIYYSPQESSIWVYIKGTYTQTNIPYDPDDLLQYTTILDPVLTVGDVPVCSVENTSGELEVSMTADDYASYSGIYKIFSSSGASISHIDLEYTITYGGYIAASKQVFKLSDGEVLEMDKSYVNIGSAVSIPRPVIPKH